MYFQIIDNTLNQVVVISGICTATISDPPYQTGLARHKPSNMLLFVLWTGLSYCVMIPLIIYNKKCRMSISLSVVDICFHIECLLISLYHAHAMVNYTKGSMS